MAITTGSHTYVRSVASAVTTNGAASLTGPANSFFPSDVGAVVTGTGINAAGATVLTYNSGTSVTLSANSSASGTVTVTVGPRLPGSAGFQGWRPEADTRAADYTVAANNAGTVPLDRLTDNITRVVQFTEH